MGPFEAQVLSTIFGVVGGVTGLGLILRYMLRKKELEVGTGDSGLGHAVDALRDDLNDTRVQLAEVQERLDFTERLLTEARGSQSRTERG